MACRFKDLAAALLYVREGDVLNDLFTPHKNLFLRR